MSREFLVIITFSVSLFATLLALFALFIAFLPRQYTRAIRRPIARLVLWQYARGTAFTSRLYKRLWSTARNGLLNPENGDDGE